MATTSIDNRPLDTIDELVDYWIAPDPYHRGRHNSVMRDSRLHVWSVIADLEGSNWDVAAVAKARDLPEDAIRAAIAFREQHRALFDADQLLREEEWNS